jgi:hypothetical protein
VRSIIPGDARGRRLDWVPEPGVAVRAAGGQHQPSVDHTKREIVHGGRMWHRLSRGCADERIPDDRSHIVAARGHEQSARSFDERKSADLAAVPALHTDGCAGVGVPQAGRPGRVGGAQQEATAEADRRHCGHVRANMDRSWQRRHP